MNTAQTYKEVNGPADLYDRLLAIKAGHFPNGTTTSCFVITKKKAKEVGIDWSFVVASVELLGLAMTNRSGIHGHRITK